MKPLSPGLQVDGLQVQAILSRHRNGFLYRVVDTRLGKAFDLEELAPVADGISRGEDGALQVTADAEARFDQQRDRFLVSAQRQSKVDHPTLPPLLRVVEALGTVFLLRPARDGESLAEQAASTPDNTSARGRELLEALVDGLGQLHGADLLHGRISPEVIALDNEGHPYFTAAGLPASGGEAEPDPERYTTAPEALKPNASPAASWDSYALAATLLSWLDRAPIPLAKERLAAVSSGAADPLDLAALRRRGSLADALAHALELDPDDRPANLAAWAASLAGVDDRLAMIREADSAADPEEPRPWGPLLLAGVVTVLMVAAGVFLLSNREASLEGWLEDVNLGEERDRGVRIQAPTSEEQARWEAALDADTLIGYRTFLEDYPTSLFSEQAQLQIDILDERAWATLSEEDTRPAYEDYLEDFRTGLHQAEALRRIEEIDAEAARQERERLDRERRDNAAWAEARLARTINSMQQYIQAWPAGLHIDEAQRIRRELQDQANDNAAMETARTLDTLDAFQAYIDAFPRGAHVTEALQSIDRLTLTAGKPFRDCAECPELRVMPIGAFRQGAADTDPLAVAQERPQRVVNITRPFAVGIYEVTMGQWDVCVDEGGCNTRPPDNGWGRGDRPVMMVSWNDAQEYVSWLSQKTGQIYRLPTESEWEYFARADSRGPWLGDSPEAVCTFGNIAGAETGFDWQHEACADPATVGTTPVGAFRPNRAGVFDVIGNVAEWTADCMNLSYLDAPTDGSAWTRGICSSHMTRGGSWVTGSQDIRLSSRFNLKNGDRNDFTGFRVVREINE